MILAGAGVVAALYVARLSSAPLSAATLMFVVLALVTGSIAIRLPLVRASLSMDTLFVFALLLLGAEEAAVLVSGLSMSVGELRSGDGGRPGYVLPFNFATGVLSAAAAANAMALVPRVEGALVWGVIAMALAYFAVNAFLVAAAMSQTRGGHVPLRAAMGAVAFTAPAFLGAGCVAGVTVWAVEVSPILGLLVVPLAVLLYATILAHRERLEAAQEHVDEIERLYLPTVAAIAAAIEARDAADGGHHARVQELSLALAEELGLSDASTLRAVRFGALLHDLGRIAISDAVLLKEGELTACERRQLEMHPVLGAELIRHIPFDAPVADAIRYHHERWDGRGYPEGLSGDGIPLPARLIAVAEVYDTVTRSRLARRTMTAEEALVEIQREAGRQFDPQVVAALQGALRRIRHDATPAQRPCSAIKAIASGALSQGLELRMSKALEPTASLAQVLEVAARESAGVLPITAWALLVTTPGEPQRAVATLGDVPLQEPSPDYPLDRAALDVGGWWSLLAHPEGQPSLTLPLPTRAPGCWELALCLSGEPGGELLTSALSQALLHPLTAAINRISEMEAGERLALCDPLTGVGNRLAMERALKRLGATDEPLGLILLDLNNFKGINDHFGHDIGDEALRRVGAALRDIACDSSVEAFRPGGDEFVLLAPVQRRVLELLCVRVRREIAKVELEVTPGELLPMGTSLGRAWSAAPPRDTAALFKAADQDMFADKRANPDRLPRGARPETRRRPSLLPGAQRHQRPPQRCGHLS
ncbi:MAG: hypothetical protein CMH57_00110 [Myxococcales bacterium]|nr:hypothetical protein [Myxococcales bacterium]